MVIREPEMRVGIFARKRGRGMDVGVNANQIRG